MRNLNCKKNTFPGCYDRGDEAAPCGVGFNAKRIDNVTGK